MPCSNTPWMCLPRRFLRKARRLNGSPICPMKTRILSCVFPKKVSCFISTRPACRYCNYRAWTPPNPCRRNGKNWPVTHLLSTPTKRLSWSFLNIFFPSPFLLLSNTTTSTSTGLISPNVKWQKIIFSTITGFWDILRRENLSRKFWTNCAKKWKNTAMGC